LILTALLVVGSGPSQAQQAAPSTASTPIDLALRRGNFDQAAALLTQRAGTGDVEAQYLLGSLYRTGRGVSQDDAAAFRWMKRAAEQGHAKAQFNVGKMYLSGRGVAMDPHEAQAWLAKAAASGHSEASRLLSEIPEPGGTPLTTGGWTAAVKIEKPLASDVAPRPPADRVVGRNGQAAILDAAWRGQSQAVAQLVASGANVMVRDENGNTPLALAAAGGARTTVEILLGAGAEVNTSNRAGETPLMQAAARGHAAVVDLLLGGGARTDSRSSTAESALSLAVRA
jgi:TPR repeat protein